MISTTEMPERDIAANTRAAMPTIPFIPGPETLNIAILFRLEIPFTGRPSSSDVAPISVPVRLRVSGVFNQARDLELGDRGDSAGVKNFSAEVRELHGLLGTTSTSVIWRPAPVADRKYKPRQHPSRSHNNQRAGRPPARRQSNQNHYGPARPVRLSRYRQ